MLGYSFGVFGQIINKKLLKIKVLLAEEFERIVQIGGKSYQVAGSLPETIAITSVPYFYVAVAF